jgi:ribonuclease HII
MPGNRRAIPGVDDSKKLVRAERERLAPLILQRAIAVGIGAASVVEIDNVNIFNATVLAMRRALTRLPVEPAEVIIDGRALRQLGIPHRGVVGGDDRCFTIACASIVAKVTRDRLMRRLATRYPGFSWQENVGYGTPAHLEAVRALGPTPHHRRTFLRPPWQDESTPR